MRTQVVSKAFDVALKFWEMKRLLFLGFAVTLLAAFTMKDGTHANWDALLKKHVNSQGYVDYKGFMADKAKLQSYLDHLSKGAPTSSWSEKDKMAYWINVYNAFTIKAIIDHYPVKSITDIKPKTGEESIWKKKFFKIGGVSRSLDEVENKILRVEFNDPRIHFAINCASESCPKLLNQAFRAANLEGNLDKLARGFVNDPKRNKITASSAQISSIFDWFKGDFTKKGTVIEYLNKYSKTKINSNAKVTYLNYDWSLNSQ